MMASTKDNMMKSAAAIGGTPDASAKMASNKEMAMAAPT